MYLVDTNIWLERLLDQEQSDSVGHMLDILPPDQLLISDFSLHSIGVILGRLRCVDVLPEFVQDIFVNSAIAMVSVTPGDLSKVVATMSEFGIDFDDAYQYEAAKQLGAYIISFDKDFDKTNIKRKTPADIAREYA